MSHRAIALCAVLGISFLGAGCSGGGGATPPLTGQLPNQQTPASDSGATLTTQSTTTSNLLTIQGKIVALVSGGGIDIQDPHHGFTVVYPTSSTSLQYDGLTPKVGEYAVASVTSLNGTVHPAAVALGTTLQAAQTASQGSSATPAPSNLKTVQGPIVALVSGGGIDIKDAHLGYTVVYPTSSTTLQYGGLTPKVGEYAVASTASLTAPVHPAAVALGTTLQAAQTASQGSSATPAPSNLITVQGPISALVSGGGIDIKDAHLGYTVVYPTSSTTLDYNGLTPKVGEYAVATTASLTSPVHPASITLSTSAGSGGSTPAPTSSPAPTGGIPTHIMTMAHVYGYAGTPTSIALGSMSPYVSWAFTDEQHAAALRAAGIKVAIYMNFWRNYTSDNPNVGYVDLKPGGAHAAAEAKTCSGSVVYDKTYGGGYEADPRSSAAAGHAAVFANYVKGEFGSNYDALFSDDTGSIGGIPLPCNWTLSDYQSAANAVHASLHVPVLVNALGAWAASGVTPAMEVGYTNASNVIGAMGEGFYLQTGSNGADAADLTTQWTGKEQAEIATIAAHKIFWDCARGSNYAQNDIALRNFLITSFLLTYDPKYAMMQTTFKTSSGFTVMPETGVVPESPLTTETSISGYQRSGGAYMREFSSCYYRGVLKGHCAVIVNPNSSAVSIPATTYSYGHSMVISGSGVIDGGSVSFSGSRPSSLASGTGVILFP